MYTPFKKIIITTYLTYNYFCTLYNIKITVRANAQVGD